MAEITIFKRGEDAEYADWVRANPRGRVLNRPNLMLHLPFCEHLSDGRAGAGKVCAAGDTAEADLERWARTTTSRRVLHCDWCGNQ